MKLIIASVFFRTDFSQTLTKLRDNASAFYYDIMTINCSQFSFSV